MIDLAATVNPAEIIWILCCLGGCYSTYRNLREARKDKDSLVASGLNGILMIHAKGAVEDQVLIFIAIFAELLLGTFALFSLPSENARGGVSIGAVFGPWVLIAGCVALIRLSYIQGKRRIKINEALLIKHQAGQIPPHPAK